MAPSRFVETLFAAARWLLTVLTAPAVVTTIVLLTRTNAWESVLALATHTVWLSLLTLATFWLDKRAARLGAWWIPEFWLHAMEALGGWPGALLGQRWVRHKSYKPAYRWAMIGAISLNCLAVGVVMWIKLGGAG